MTVCWDFNWRSLFETMHSLVLSAAWEANCGWKSLRQQNICNEFGALKMRVYLIWLELITVGFNWSILCKNRQWGFKETGLFNIMKLYYAHACLFVSKDSTKKIAPWWKIKFVEFIGLEALWGRSWFKTYWLTIRLSLWCVKALVPLTVGWPSWATVYCVQSEYS